MSSNNRIRADLKIGLSYAFGEKGDFLMVIFSGKMTSREEIIMKQCETDLRNKSHKAVLFSFAKVSQITPGVHIVLTHLQKALRDNGKLLGLCEIRSEEKKLLIMSGIVRESELFENIGDGWKTLSLRLFESA